MYSLAKNLITEKDLSRKISLLENLVNHPQLTAKELAANIGTTERTVFNDIQSLRSDLPMGWQLEADGNNGLSLISADYATTNEVWEYFMKDSISIQLIKKLLFSKKLAVQTFVNTHGISFETLKRHTKKVNQKLKDFQLRITVSATAISLTGEESSIRVFYHRLLLPFTHNNFFFEEYAIHQTNYRDFLARISRAGIGIETEEIFGTCWFFINTIRIKAGCLTEDFHFDEEDALFKLYHKDLEKLYASEGIRLNKTEHFFAFFCFIESWNYSVIPDAFLKNLLLKEYPDLFAGANRFVSGLSAALNQNNLDKSDLTENLVLFLLKYFESKQLSDKFLLEYHELSSLSQRRFPELYQLISQEVKNYGLDYLSDSGYVINTLAFLIKEALYSISPRQITAYFLFQGEPAWKSFLYRELQDLLGNRVHLKNLNTDELSNYQLEENDIIISNYPLQYQSKQTVVYVSSIPTQNEMQEIRELIRPFYL
ncbi:helix-turn-helix domain-containing protein [Enterococcus sp. BWB1-3]|uniref:helix-turn-helix domain-containing protein n=1 Tax=unclassified Enterococcus TaxID=2608891 RepID=UPI001924FE11|nr:MULTISPECIES: helix-turn-helix domain-containing protein [unclassified Enterococcus]MBL1229143.1 helix-turn-helix domain-containing protein [Enterococcus sp. BWB1-3]MCB5952523.1 helix-turn-helix domain-containing protein [Enterococcus sp. BWT-B8]